MSLFKKKENGSSDSVQDQLAKINDQLIFLEKKIDMLLESRQGGRRFGGHNRDRGGFNQHQGGNNFRSHGGNNSSDRNDNNTRFAGQGPTRYNSGRPSFGGHRGGNRHQGRHNNQHRRPRPHQGGQGHSAPETSFEAQSQPQSEQSSAE